MKIENILMELVLLTNQLVDKLSDVTYEELVSFTEERERLVQKLVNIDEKPTDYEKKQILSILHQDSLIKSRMEFFKSEASIFLEKQGAIKAQQEAYQALYKPESLFYDNRK